jgi:hypothetical protein
MRTITTPRRQYTVTLGGEWEITTTDGETRRPARKDGGWCMGQVVADSDDIGRPLASRQCLHRTGSFHPFFA